MDTDKLSVPNEFLCFLWLFMSWLTKIRAGRVHGKGDRGGLRRIQYRATNKAGGGMARSLHESGKKEDRLCGDYGY